MTEISVTPTQVEDSLAAIHDAVDTTFGSVETAYYNPDASKVPRPSFDLFETAVGAFAEARGVEVKRYGGRVEINPQSAEVVRDFPGLRGLARGRVQSNGGVEVLQGPFIVIARDRIAMLTAEAPTNIITEMQHSFLSIEYEKATAQVSDKHTSHDVANAGATAPALVVVSSIEAGSAHHDLHGLAPAPAPAPAPAQTGTTFGTNFSHQGRQDIQVGHDTRKVRSAILPLTSVQMFIGADDQLPSEAKLLGLGLKDSELAVGMTLAASQSRGMAPNLRANLSSMVGE